MKIQIPDAEIKAAISDTFANLVGVERQLSDDARAQVEALIDELYPLVVSETQALLSATNPAVPQAYLGVLQGCVDAAVAKLALRAIAEHRRQLAAALQTGIHILAMVLRAAVVA